MMRDLRNHASSILLPVLVACGVAVPLTSGPRDASASVAIAVSLEELAGASSVIARVTALDRESAWEDGRIVTYTHVRVDAVIAGASPRAMRELRIRTLGGEVGSVGQRVEGEAALSPSSASIVFLMPYVPRAGSGEAACSSPLPTVLVTGRAQGQLVVARDVAGREIVRAAPAGAIVDRSVRPPLRPTGRRVVDLDGSPAEAAVADAQRAWEAGHAR